MNSNTLKIVQNYKNAMVARNAIPTSVDCPIYQNLQKAVEHWRKHVRKLQNDGVITNNETWEFLKPSN